MRWLYLATLLLVGCGGARGYEITRTFGAEFGSVRAADRHPEVRALPVIGRISGGATQLVLRGRMSAQRARRVVRMARATVFDVATRFLRDEPMAGRPPVDVCVFYSRREYDRFVRALYGAQVMPRYGFYLESERLLVVNLSRSVVNLKHEIVHPLLRDDFGGIPDWMNEGLAALYGTARHRGGSYRFVVNNLLRDLSRARRLRELPTLEQLAASDYDDVHGRNWRFWYATGSLLLLYLERAGRLEEFYRAARASEITDEGQLTLLRQNVDYAQFVAWTRKLDVGMVVSPQRPTDHR